MLLAFLHTALQEEETRPSQALEVGQGQAAILVRRCQLYYIARLLQCAHNFRMRDWLQGPDPVLAVGALSLRPVELAPASSTGAAAQPSASASIELKLPGRPRISMQDDSGVIKGLEFANRPSLQTTSFIHLLSLRRAFMSPSCSFIATPAIFPCCSRPYVFKL